MLLFFYAKPTARVIFMAINRFGRIQSLIDHIYEMKSVTEPTQQGIKI